MLKRVDLQKIAQKFVFCTIGSGFLLMFKTF